MDGLHQHIDALLPELVPFRHELHAHPEIRFCEEATSARIAGFLDAAGIPYTRGWAKGTGIVATIPGGGRKTIALRADIDALELEERTGLPYASTVPGLMHACGHDGHTACLCGVGKVLASLGDKLPNTVRLIFQPGEETGGGGRYMVEEGAMKGVDAAYALHGWPEIATGKIGLRSGPAMAGADLFRITVYGTGCHGAHPDLGVDPIVTAAHIVLALQTIVSRELDPVVPAVVTVGKITSGFTDNIIPESAVIEGTFRMLTRDVGERIREAITRIAKSTAAAFRARAEVELTEDSYIPLANDPGATAAARRILAETLGAEAVVDIAKPSMGAEDFAYYLEKAPGAMMMLGVARRGQRNHPLHSPYFDFDDDALRTGMLALTALATAL